MKYENLLRIRRVGRRDVNCLTARVCVYCINVCIYMSVCVCVCFSFGQFSHAAAKVDWALDCDL